MRTFGKNLLLSLPIWLAILMPPVFLSDSSAAVGGIPGGNLPKDTRIDRTTKTATILSVLETRIEDPRLLAKTKDKLSSLHGRELRLIASLCDRIAADDQTAGADIAFSLVAALIVLS